MILSILVRKNPLGLVTGLGVAGAVFALHSSAGAHAITGQPCSVCSPHAACGSKSGTAFSNCVATRTATGGKKASWRWTWDRDITCAAGTACANALCGSGHAVTGGATGQACIETALCYTDSTYKHGIPLVNGLVCD